MQRGVCCWFDAKKGYGFITPNTQSGQKNNDGDHFVHRSDISTKERVLKKGKEYTYSLARSNGKMNAVAVSRCTVDAATEDPPDNPAGCTHPYGDGSFCAKETMFCYGCDYEWTVCEEHYDFMPGDDGQFYDVECPECQDVYNFPSQSE